MKYAYAVQEMELTEAQERHFLEALGLKKKGDGERNEIWALSRILGSHENRRRAMETPRSAKKELQKFLSAMEKFRDAYEALRGTEAHAALLRAKANTTTALIGIDERMVEVANVAVTIMAAEPKGRGGAPETWGVRATTTDLAVLFEVAAAPEVLNYDQKCHFVELGLRVAGVVNPRTKEPWEGDNALENAQKKYPDHAKFVGLERGATLWDSLRMHGVESCIPCDGETLIDGEIEIGSEPLVLDGDGPHEPGDRVDWGPVVVRTKPH